jgi:hypothetical protein
MNELVSNLWYFAGVITFIPHELQRFDTFPP